MTRPFNVAAMLVVAALLGACSSGQQGGSMESASAPKDVTPSGAWRSLIDPALTAWRGYKQDGMPGGWRVENGVLMKDGPTPDIMTREQFGDFELAFDWKLAPGGNAGVFYRATERYDRIYWSGPEYQLLDDARHADGRRRVTAAGAAYGLYPAPEGAVKAAGEWNATRILVRGNHVEHWLNGQQTANYDLGSADWLAKVAASKFVEYPEYGRAARGHISLQGDHTGALALRDLRIRVLQ